MNLNEILTKVLEKLDTLATKLDGLGSELRTIHNAVKDRLDNLIGGLGGTISDE